MELFGKVTRVNEGEVKTSQAGNEYFRQLVVIQTGDSHLKEVAFVVKNKQLQNCVSVGQSVVVNFYVESREYQGRWYTEAVAMGFKVAQEVVSNPIDRI